MTFGTTTKTDAGTYEPTTHWTGGATFNGLSYSFDQIGIGQFDNEQLQWWLDREDIGAAIETAVNDAVDEPDHEQKFNVMITPDQLIDYIESDVCGVADTLG